MEPVYNVDGSALVSMLALAGTALLLVALALVAGWLALRGRRRGARRTVLAAVGVAAVYGIVLVAVSFRAEERVIAPGGWKYFCEPECRLAYSVAGVERPASRATRTTAVEIVTLNLRFDPATAGPEHGGGALHPNPRRVVLIASDGRSYPISHNATSAIEKERGLEPGLHRLVRPGETIRIPLAFELPAGARGERLHFAEQGGPIALMIGHEGSAFHPPTTFALAPSDERTARQ